MNHSPRICRGLSLLEVLVTVSIFAMLFGVLMAGWHQSMSSQARLDETAQQVQQRQRLATLIRLIVSEALNPPGGAGKKFSGDLNGFSVESSTSMNPRIGAAPDRVAIQLKNQSSKLRLILIQQDNATNLFAWKFSAAGFSYADEKGVLHNQWPPASNSESYQIEMLRNNHLPTLVIFSYKLDEQDDSREVLAAPRNSPWELAEPTPPFLGLGP